MLRVLFIIAGLFTLHAFLAQGGAPRGVLVLVLGGGFVAALILTLMQDA